MNTYHFVVVAHPFKTPLTERNACVDLWRRLKVRFPKVVACVLMPNHFHLIVRTSNLKRARWHLQVEQRAWTQRFHPGKSMWTSVPLGEKVQDQLHLKRLIRYVHLNPCRAKIVSDPFLWEWSTHRDVTGCVTEPWSDLSTLMECFDVSSRTRLGETMHRYISGDPSVAVAGTSMIRAYRAGAPISTDCSVILKAAAVARREEIKSRQGDLRNLVVHTSHFLKLKPAPQALGITLRSWHRILEKKVDTTEIAVVLKILADSRCR